MSKRESPKPGGRPRKLSRFAQLESQREQLLQRLARLPPGLQRQPGYRSAKALLTIRYMRSKLPGRAAILQAAQFMIAVLELLPPV